MANSLLKGLAIAIGSGLAFAAGRKIGQKSGRRTNSGAAQEWDLRPLARRLAALETRLGQTESVAVSNGAPLKATALQQTAKAVESTLAAQRQEMDSLRHDVRAVESRSAEHISALSQKIESLESRLPLEIDNAIAARIGEMEGKMQMFQETHSRSLEAFVETLESKVLGRISRLESTLAEQSHAIAGMREKSSHTEDSMQKVLAAIERLADIRQPEVHPPLPIPSLAPVAVREPVVAARTAMYGSAPPREPQREPAVAPRPAIFDPAASRVAEREPAMAARSARYDPAPAREPESKRVVVAAAGAFEPAHSPKRGVPFVFSLITISVAVGLQLSRSYRH